MNGVDYALYVRRTFKSKWRLVGTFDERDDANAAAHAATEQHTWVTEVPRPKPEADPTMEMLLLVGLAVTG